MRDWKAAFIAAICVLGIFTLVAGVYIALHPEVTSAFLGTVATK